MAKRKIPRGLRKYLRKEKARIRREFFDIDKQQQEIKKLYQKVFKDKDNKIENYDD